MPYAQPLLSELEREAAITRRVLERVPSDQLQWRPHDKSMSLGQLAFHIANIPGGICTMLQQESFQINPESLENPKAPQDKSEILAALEKSLDTARTFLGGLTDQQAESEFRMMAGPVELFAIPKHGAVRVMILSHWCHHRGQLSVYLRLLNVPVPAIYGVSADDNPFRRATAS